MEIACYYLFKLFLADYSERNVETTYKYVYQ